MPIGKIQYIYNLQLGIEFPLHLPYNYEPSTSELINTAYVIMHYNFNLESARKTGRIMVCLGTIAIPLPQNRERKH